MTAGTMRHMKLPARFALIGLLLLAAGCLYRMPIQQGNVLLDEQVSQLQTGMTRPQVMFLLGTPMVPNGFNQDRWDYYYSVHVGEEDRVTRRLIVWFKDDKVERFEGNALDTIQQQPATAAATPPPGN